MTLTVAEAAPDDGGPTRAMTAPANEPASAKDRLTTSDRPTASLSPWTLAPLRAAERPLLERLAELYLYDFTEVAAWEIGEDGRYEPAEWARSLWDRAGRRALLLRVAGKPAGFAIVDERSPEPGGADRRYLAEFFVLRRYRRRGLGAAAARAVFDRFPGGWHVLEIPENVPAQRFWRRVIGAYTGGRYTEFRNRYGDLVQVFETGDRTPDGTGRTVTGSGSGAWAGRR